MIHIDQLSKLTPQQSSVYKQHKQQQYNYNQGFLWQNWIQTVYKQDTYTQQ